MANTPATTASSSTKPKTAEFHSFHGLHTHHDRFFLPKGLGVSALLHFFIRFFLLVWRGSMGFDPYSKLTMLGVSLHGLLSLSGLKFHVPLKRTPEAPMTWREAQNHSVIFAFRSLLAMALLLRGFHLKNEWLIRLRCVPVMLCHLLADYVSAKMGQGTTMRGMTWPKGTSLEFINKANYFYGASQLLAVLFIIIWNFEILFLTIFPIQLALFCGTLVRKHVITMREWHIIYAFSLSTGYFYLLMTIPLGELGPLLLLAACIVLLRFYFRVNKYIIWAPVCVYAFFFPPSCEFLWSLDSYESAFGRRLQC